MFFVDLSTVQYHEEYQLDPPANDPIMHGSTTIVDEILVMDDTENPISRKDLLANYEQLLEDYHTSVADINLEQQEHSTINDDQFLLLDESNGYSYQKDDVYEADIHLSIGTLYMEEFGQGIRTSRITQAMNHFEQAVRLYEMSGDVDSTINMALAKYNVFLLHLHDGNYRVASRRFNEAIDGLRQVDAIATADADIYDDYYNDPTLVNEITNVQQQRNNKRNQQPYKSSKQQRKTLVKATTASTDTSKASSMAGRSFHHERYEDDVESTTAMKGKPSIYVDLQHYLNQNESSVKEEL